jgi:hypothetical protein
MSTRQWCACCFPASGGRARTRRLIGGPERPLPGLGRDVLMNSILYIIGAIVVVFVVLKVLGPY